MAYAAITGTKRNLKVIKEAGWGLIVAPVHRGRDFSGWHYALDNGAWTAYTQHEPWDEQAFVELVEQYGVDADFVVAPDVVCGGLDSLARSLSWLPWLQERSHLVLLAVQNGMEPKDLCPYVGPNVGLFVGGDATWKESSLPLWGQLARDRNCYLHVGRVNTRRRIRLCALAGADSIDGSSVSRYAVTLKTLEAELQQPILPFTEAL